MVKFALFQLSLIKTLNINAVMMSNITPSIKYIGVDDLDIDLFESQYVVPEGMSYNSYLIEDEHICIMDTADGRKGEQWLANLDEALAGHTPDYLVVHHMEPDHASLIRTVAERFPRIRIVLSDKAEKMLANFFPAYDFSGRTIAVKDGDTLNLGEHSLKFVAAPMVHWPEVMVSYDSKDKVLFSADGFGKFGALCNETDDWACEARRYYFNICGKYGINVQRLLAAASKLEINIICPLHGPVLKENLGYYINLYDIWSKYEAETNGVLVAYASIHGGTRAVAEKVAQMLEKKGLEKVSIMDLSRCDMAEAIEDAFRMSRLVVAASSYDASVFPPMYDFVHHLAIKGYQSRKVAIIENGSWAPSVIRTIKPMFESMKNIALVEPMVTIWSRMKESDVPALEQLVDAIAE